MRAVLNLFVFLAMSVAVGCGTGKSTAPPSFEAGESQLEVIEHHRRIPTDDHWWNVRGPEMGWMHRHVQQIFPTVAVHRSGPVRELDYSLDARIAAVVIDTPDGPMSFAELLRSDVSTTLGVVILHEGKVVFEDYPRMRDYEKVMYWSVSKVLTGTLTRILEERSEIDVSMPVEHYVPRLADSVHAGTTIENLLDMATGVDCEDNYEDPESCYYLYSEAIGDNLRDGDSPDDPYEFLATVEIERTGEQGTKYVYSGATNFILMWVLEQVTGHTYPDLLTREIWQHIGAESDAAIIAYRYGIPLSHGGFISRMRDLARFGLLYTPSWRVVADRQVISDEHMAAILRGGRPGLRNSRYMWGDLDENGWLSHGGWGGQGLFVHPEKDLVAVFTSYMKEDFSEVNLEQAVLRALNEVFVGVD
jgi:CubicO group peptidase (beta-lactamase class C family)